MNHHIKSGLACLVFVCAGLWTSAAYAQTPIRISCDSAVRFNPSVVDSNTQQSVQWVRGDYLAIEVGLFDKGVFVSNNISRFATISCQVYAAQNDSNPPMMAQTVTNGGAYWNPNCSLGAWASNLPPDTNYNVEFQFTDAQTSIPLNNQASQTYWVRIFAVTTDSVPRIITYEEAPVTIYDGPITSESAAPSFSGFVFVDGAGTLLSPANFFNQNEAAMGAALSAGGFFPTSGNSNFFVATNNLHIVTTSGGGNLTNYVDLTNGTVNLKSNLTVAASGVTNLNMLGIGCYGDSLTAGVNCGLLDYPFVLGTNSGRYALNAGIGGQTSGQILTRLYADANSYGTYVIEMGRNNYTATATNAAFNAADHWTTNQAYNDTAYAVNWCKTNGNKRVLVLSVINGFGLGENGGSSPQTDYVAITNLNGAIATNIAALDTNAQYFDIREWLVQQANTGVYPTDNTNLSYDIPAYHLLCSANAPHLNDAGTLAWGNEVALLLSTGFPNNYVVRATDIGKLFGGGDPLGSRQLGPFVVSSIYFSETTGFYTPAPLKIGVLGSLWNEIAGQTLGGPSNPFGSAYLTNLTLSGVGSVVLPDTGYIYVGPSGNFIAEAGDTSLEFQSHTGTVYINTGNNLTLLSGQVTAAAVLGYSSVTGSNGYVTNIFVATNITLAQGSLYITNGEIYLGNSGNQILKAGDGSLEFISGTGTTYVYGGNLSVLQGTVTGSAVTSLGPVTGSNTFTTNLYVGTNVYVAQTAAATNGFASYATNTYTLNATGITNSGTKAMRLIGFTGTSVYQSNVLNIGKISRGTITAPVDITLQPNECLFGTGCSDAATMDW